MRAFQNPRFRYSILEQLQHPLRRRLPDRRHFSSKNLFNGAEYWTQTGSRSLWRYDSIRRNFQRFWQTRLQSTQNTSPKPDVTPNLGSPSGSLSFSQRMRKLSREYGWAAFGIYMGLSALDFPFCFLAVRALGTERIGQWEHQVIHGFWDAVTYPFPQLAKYAPSSFNKRDGAKESEKALAQKDGSEGQQAAEWSWGVDEAEKNYKANATLWTQLALAYAIHKSFIFIRVPLAAAVTPKVVKTLRGWGWNIGKRKPKNTASSSSASS